MCGIVGFTGGKAAEKLILDSLELLEYRGYDSAGLACHDSAKNEIVIYKCAGRVSDLREKCASEVITTSCGIGHTRWATHGGVTDENAHPHHKGKVTLVHNGIIENYRELRAEFHLENDLASETDSEIVAAVMDHFYSGDPAEAIKETVKRLKGTFALVILFEDIPGKIFAMRNVSPIVAANIKGGSMLASDVAALGGHAEKYFAVPEMTLLTLTEEGIDLRSWNGDPIEPDYIDIDWDTSVSGKGKYPFYMLKEIMDQPRVLQQIIDSHTRDGKISFDAEGIPDELLTSFNHIQVIACGTAMHAGMIFQAVVRKRLRIRVDVECASEFIYSHPILGPDSLVIAISQSGETIDTLTALRYAKAQGAKSLSVINVRGTSIARESDYVIYTDAGPEIAVASTKAYTSQIAALLLLAGKIAEVRGCLDSESLSRYTADLQGIPALVKNVLDRETELHHVARSLLEAKDAFMIGRGMDYTILLEGALKLKEISYIHTEAYASGELKHGTIALITADTPVIGLVTQDDLMSKELSNIREVQARDAKVTLLIREDINFEAETLSTFARVFTLPKADGDFMVFPSVAALQLLAFFVSADRGLDVDKPRNLAKVVTVE